MVDPTIQIKAYDHFFSANIKIKKNKIKFLNFTDLLTYQSWSPDNKINENRCVYKLKIQNWVDINFTKYNQSNQLNPHQPTAVMQIGYKYYIIVIKNAIYNEKCKYKLVFHISTKKIISKYKNKLPNGKFKHVRFDIDGFDRKIGNLINNLKPRKLYDNDYFKKEQYDYGKQRKYRIKQNETLTVQIPIGFSGFGMPSIYLDFINSGLPIWDQGQTDSCVAHATGFLYLYIMAIGLNNSISPNWEPDAPLWPILCFPGTNQLMNSFSRLLTYQDECQISRSFIMWAAYNTPIGTYNNITTYSIPPPPSTSNGTQISNALVGLQTWGCIPILKKDIFIFSEFENKGAWVFDQYNQFANLPANDPPTGDISTLVTNFNTLYNEYWSRQSNNNFNIYTVSQDADSIVLFLKNGFPVTISMTIINYNLNGNGGIGLINENGLENVLQFTDTSQIQNNIALAYHAVIAVGFTVINNQVYVFIRNSWGTNFGSGGHFWMPMSFIVSNDSILGQPNCTGLYTIGFGSNENTIIEAIEASG
jgi:hypothetical protein